MNAHHTHFLLAATRGAPMGGMPRIVIGNAVAPAAAIPPACTGS